MRGRVRAERERQVKRAEVAGGGDERDVAAPQRRERCGGDGHEHPPGGQQDGEGNHRGERERAECDLRNEHAPGQPSVPPPTFETDRRPHRAGTQQVHALVDQCEAEALIGRAAQRQSLGRGRGHGGRHLGVVHDGGQRLRPVIRDQAPQERGDGREVGAVAGAGRLGQIVSGDARDRSRRPLAVLKRLDHLEVAAAPIHQSEAVERPAVERLEWHTRLLRWGHVDPRRSRGHGG